MAGRTTRRLGDHRAAAQVLPWAPASLRRKDFRTTHRIPYFRFGKLIRYDLDELARWTLTQRAAGSAQ